MGCASSGDAVKNPSSSSASGGKSAGAAKGNGLFHVENPGKIADFYDVEKKKLGEGSYGSVSKAKSKSNNQIRAVKCIAKVLMKNEDRFKQEISIMKMMDHPNIMRLHESFEDNKHIYLVMDLAGGGELFDRIIEAGHFTEVQAAILMQQIVRAIFYMHEHHVCHRDLKPENFLFMTRNKIDNNVLKIIDFGLSCLFSPDKYLTTKAGTPYYVAPQVLAGKYDQSSDLWSVGVIMFVMLCGYPPFFGETDADVLAKVKLGNFSFNAADWKNISEDAKSLIRMLLKMNPKDRYTAELALNHIWIKNKAPQAKEVNLQESVIENLCSFKSHNRLKRMALHIIAGQLNDDQIVALRKAFTAMDANQDGSLSKDEIKKGLIDMNLKDLPDIDGIIDGMDRDNSGIVDYREFLAACIDQQKFLQEDVCFTVFKRFDTNGDNKISKDEIMEVLKDDKVKSAIGDDISKLMGEVDTNGDGEIDFEEFLIMMRGAPKKEDTPNET